MAAFIVKDPVLRGGKRYEPGAQIELQPGEEKRLLELGVIEAAPVRAPAEPKNQKK